MALTAPGTHPVGVGPLLTAPPGHLRAVSETGSYTSPDHDPMIPRPEAASGCSAEVVAWTLAARL